MIGFQEKCFEGVKISRSAHDSSFCTVNPKFLAVVVEVMIEDNGIEGDIDLLID